MNYADRTKTKEQFQSNLWLPGNISHAVVPEEYRTGIADTDVLRQPVRHDRLRRARACIADGFWQPINSIDDPNANSNDRVNNVTNTWEVNEKLTTAFVKFGIDTELGSLPLRGNIGVQAIQADQTSDLHLTNTPIPAEHAVVPITMVDRRRQVHRLCCPASTWRSSCRTT